MSELSSTTSTRGRAPPASTASGRNGAVSLASSRVSELGMGRSSRAARSPPQTSRCRRVRTDLHGEGAALVRRARRADVAAERACELAHQRKAESRSFHGSGH